MNIIKSNIENKIEINKSIFITKLIKIKDVSEVKTEMLKIKQEYKNATHYCYAYIINEYKKSSDDNEPSGTAGVQIMENLLKHNLNYVLCIIIRYFGGIKLGSNGLIRAYSNSTNSCIKKANIKKLINGYLIKIESNYNNQKLIEYILKKSEYKKTYANNIIYNAKCSNDIIEILNNSNIKYEILKNIEIEVE